MTVQVLLLEDDRRLAGMIAEYLGQAGFPVHSETLGRRALERLKSGGIEALVLDLTLPDIDGLDLCREIRMQSGLSALPIIMLTARGDAADRIVGLELGADDYLPKPFEPRELLARLRAILRRSERGQVGGGEAILRFGRLEIDCDTYQVRLGGETRSLTAHQFALLRLLARNAGRVLSRDWLLDALSGSRAEGFDRSIDVHVSKLRAVIEDDPKRPRRILTLRGAGYVFARTQD
ncbi:response regulator [Dokdonella immobilis]|uniref:DNA-binding response regulator, OmpR family, contains REC and winged-helix (WHTH) domain n=1 Tax=Dokdonella immobilis TaxID=578942 RepID=A0A1I4V9L9_9GAMM|nr:response regulator transcription factor [Dokdonella immobilis]SFM97883.1 DNA-binding response regulator, OmpR family, contains REC and winged-helix (wHTH) domain [Dokdonella immobilis]